MYNLGNDIVPAFSSQYAVETWLCQISSVVEGFDIHQNQREMLALWAFLQNNDFFFSKW